ncbi:MAG: DNA gyrase subunit A [Christensenellales bacterium]|jgi:DNA gyrase subunit A
MIRDNVQPIDLEQELKKSFISYAMAVIINRALPDVRDGLKPVHRRLIYSMIELGNTPDKPHRKSVRVVGDVLGKYHPHGDSAVYETMVRLAQDFSMRYPLVDGQGNFGSVDGDEAAAMRYTEARLTKLAMELVTDLDKETVDFYPNFDETTMQPSVLPCRYPNLLVNGSSGIAVGMATNIPPHNLGEVIDGLIYMMDNPDCSIEEIMTFIKGPDFPTGGIILGTSGIHSAYRTGRGRLVVRAKAEIEEMPNNKSQIIVTEIPYQVNKAKMVEKIADLVQDKTIEGISDLRDESDRNGMRVVIELKQNVNANVVLNLLYKHTQMQNTFGVIMLALVNDEPKVLNLKDMLWHYLQLQKDVIIRRTRYDLSKAEARAHILEGLLKALDNIDEIIQMIKTSESTAAAKNALMEKLDMSEKQAQAVLDMRLARLSALERSKIQEEYAGIQQQITHYNEILGSEQIVLDIIKEEVTAIRNKYADERRTELTMIDGEIDIEDLIDEEDIAITLTHFGYVKRIALDTYKSQRRGGKGIIGMSTREEDFVEKIFVTTTHKDILFFTNKGRVYRLKGYQLPEAGRSARGTAIVNLLQLDGDEKVTAMIPADKESRGELIMATRLGLIKKTPLDDFRNLRAAGLIAIVLREGDELIGVSLSGGDANILIGTRKGMSIGFKEEDVRSMGRVSQGVKSISLDDNDTVVDMQTIFKDSPRWVMAITENGYGKRTDLDEYRLQNRAGKGIKAMNLTSKTGELVSLKIVDEEEDIIAITDDGTIIRFAAQDVSTLGRVTQGVRIMRVDEDSRIVSVVAVAKDEEDDEEEKMITEGDQEIAEAEDEAETVGDDE